MSPADQSIKPNAHRLIQERRFDEALRVLQHQQATQELSAPSFEAMGDLYLHNGQTHQACSAFLEAYARGSSTTRPPGLLYKLAETLVAEGRLMSALDIFDQLARRHRAFLDGAARARALRQEIAAQRLSHAGLDAGILRRRPRRINLTEQLQSLILPPIQDLEANADTASSFVRNGVNTDPFHALPETETRYELREQLAEGPLMTISKAHDALLERVVLIKSLSPKLNRQAAIRQAFRDVVRQAARLKHNNIATVFDSGMHDGAPFAVMEHIDGHLLSDHLQRRGRVSTPLTRHIITSIAEALDEAHHNGVVHGALSPKDVIVRTEDSRLKVMDFGLGQILLTANRAGCHVMPLERTPFVAPEVRTSRGIAATSDLFSLGVLAFVMLTGQLPTDQHDLTASRLPGLTGPTVPAPWQAFVKATMQRRPTLRPASIADALDLLPEE